MLDSLNLLRAMNGIYEEDVVMAGRIYTQKQNSGNKRKIVHLTLLAAVLISILTAGAYAMGFLGMKAIVIPEPELPPISLEEAVPSPRAQTVPEEEVREVVVSITQPQSVPEEMSSDVHEKIENTLAAWSDWLSYRETSTEIPHDPEIFTRPTGAAVINYVENGDGSYTLYYFDKEALDLIHDGENGEADFSAATPLDVRTATAEEMAAHESWMDYANLTYGDYDFNYDIHSETEAAKLEAIAEKYGLRLRHRSTLLWSKETVEEMDAEQNAMYGTDHHTDTSDPRFLTNWELCERISDVSCHGSLFREVPRGFDKVYYFDEGTFCVSYDQELADGRRVHCYGYNSMYATLSSGREVVSQISDPDRFRIRTHTAPDGTELTIMQNENEAFLYVYLSDSFFEMHLSCDTALSDTDVDTVADNLNYGNIGI